MNDNLFFLLMGVLLAAMLFGLGYLALRVRTGVAQLIMGMSSVAGFSHNIQKLTDTASQVVIELQLLRATVTANLEQGGVEAPEAEAPSALRPPRAPYPSPPMSMYRPVPNAKVEDTEVVDTSDETYAQLERLEEVRQQGYEADPAELDEA